MAIFAPLVLSSCTVDMGIIRAADDKRCVERGFTPDTEDFANCLKRLATQRSDFMEKGRLDIVNPPDSPAQERTPQ
jgi:hypothetical protein